MLVTARSRCAVERHYVMDCFCLRNFITCRLHNQQTAICNIISKCHINFKVIFIGGKDQHLPPSWKKLWGPDGQVEEGLNESECSEITEPRSGRNALYSAKSNYIMVSLILSESTDIDTDFKGCGLCLGKYWPSTNTDNHSDTSISWGGFLGSN